MVTMHPEIATTYGNRLRLRVCGILMKANKLLMVNHAMHTGNFWAPPGGGVGFGMPVKEALVREFREETGLEIHVNKFLFVCEYLAPPLHAVELFFEVTSVDGEATAGYDPETSTQIIREVRYMREEDIKNLAPPERHGLFNYATAPDKVHTLSGYLKI